jgi:hypothetical protein
MVMEDHEFFGANRYPHSFRAVGAPSGVYLTQILKNSSANSIVTQHGILVLIIMTESHIRSPGITRMFFVHYVCGTTLCASHLCNVKRDAG